MNDQIIMNPDPRAMPFGRYLKAIRVQQGIPLEEVAYETQINIRKLMLIEDEDHNQLPEAGEVRPLLRRYAEWLGVDEDDIVDRYEINRSFFYQDDPSEKGASRKPGKRFFLRLALALVFVIAVAGLSVYFFHYYQTHQPSQASDKAAPQTTGAVKTEIPDSVLPAQAAGSGEKPADASALEIPPPAEKLSLKIDAIEETMIKIGVDEADLVAYLLNPKDHIELEAASRIRMEIHNPGGVKVMLNDKPVAVNGQPGEIVSLELTHPK